MKVLLVITHGNIGGATNVVYELAAGLKKKGVDVIVGFNGGEYLLTRLSAVGVPTKRFRYLKRSRNPLNILLFINEMRRFVIREKFDAVQFNSSNTLPGALGAKLGYKNMRTIFTFHGLSILSRNYPTSSLAKFIYRLFFKFFLLFIDAPVFVSNGDLKEAKQIALVKNGTVIYNGLDETSLNLLPRDEARAALEKITNRKISEDFIVGSIGRLSFEKNYEFLITSFPEVLKLEPLAMLLLIGDGPKRKKYEKMIANLSLQGKIFLTGEVPNAAHYLKAFDVFALPSLYEGLPITLIECLFAEVPVIASNVGGISEIAPAVSLYTFNDQKGFLKAFKEVFYNLPRFKIDRIRIPEFTALKMAEQYIALAEKKFN